MLNNKTIIAIIPARGGSKGIPRKNIKPLAGKPLISWTIIEALKSKYIDNVIVSTEDPEISEISLKYGADVPFLRPKHLATDSAKGIDVYIHAINWFRKKGVSFDIVVVLQPTSPARISEDIDGALNYFLKKNADMVISVCKTEHHPYWAGTLPKDLRMDKFIDSKLMFMNRQDLPVFYRLNGAIEISTSQYLLRNMNALGKNTFAFIMSPDRSIDIDSSIDFEFAELLINKRGQ